MKDDWKSTTKELGEQSVTIRSMMLMPVSSAIALDSSSYWFGSISIL